MAEVGNAVHPELETLSLQEVRSAVAEGRVSAASFAAMHLERISAMDGLRA